MAKKGTYTWEELESVVRIISSHMFSREAKTELINGVKCDCVLHIETDNWVIVEVTEERTLAKLRVDLAKFGVIKPFLISQNIYAKCFFVTRDKPNASLVETGKGLNVDVLSVLQFSEKLFNFSDYHHERSKYPFGSAVNPFSGEKDETDYTPVSYLGNDYIDYSLKDIAKMLNENKCIVLLGNYGTGKSRCIQELFKEMVNNLNVFFKFPLAINLKDNWGLKRAAEIITRHFSDLGLSQQIDSLMKLYCEQSVCFLLDGFDEIGSQSWSDNPEKLKEIRAQSLLGVKDLIEKAKGGIIIVGREHYFNSTDELVKCLGLDKKDPILIRCKDEFTLDEMALYLKGRNISSDLPQWLPRRPLICQVINEFSIEATESIFSSNYGEVEFWELLINTICERETKIHGSLDSSVIKNVLMRVARMARTKTNNLGPITIAEIYKAFEECTGSHTTDETAIMLQRLPGLGRVGPESLDRQFIDHFLLDGLRGEDLVDIVVMKNIDVLHEHWLHPLRELGLQYVATKLQIGGNRQLFITLFNKVDNCSNVVLLGDILASLAKVEDANYDFQNRKIYNTNIISLDLSISSLQNLHIVDSTIENINIADSLASNITLENCIIFNLMGVSSSKGLPSWISNCEVDHFEAMNTVSRIRTAKLNPAQLILLSFIRKLFFQPGSGRKEAALLRGLGDSINKKLADKILKILLREDMVRTTKGYEGVVYIPNRSYSHRLKVIIDQMSLSKDKLWLDITHLGEKENF